MVGYLRVHLRLNETLILIFMFFPHTISYMYNCLHLFILSSPLHSSSPSSFYNSPHPFQCPLLTPSHTYQYAAQLHIVSPLPFTTSILFWTEKHFGHPQQQYYASGFEPASYHIQCVFQVKVWPCKHLNNKSLENCQV